MKVLYNKLIKVERFLNDYLAFFFANGNKQYRIENYYKTDYQG